LKKLKLSLILIKSSRIGGLMVASDLGVLEVPAEEVPLIPGVARLCETRSYPGYYCDSNDGNSDILFNTTRAEVNDICKFGYGWNYDAVMLSGET
jgi:pyruvate kinase